MSAMKKLKRALKKKLSFPNKVMPYVLKNNYIQVTLHDGRSFECDNTHPTFADLKKALKAKDWQEVPLLVNEAEKIAFVTEGLVKVTSQGVFYNDNPVHSSLAVRIMDMSKEGKDIRHLLKFMDNLHMNPSQHAKDRFYDWIKNNDLPITDDGCCMAYKYVDNDLRDTYTGTVDNSPGRRIIMDRKVANTDYSTECATGFHLCSKMYGTYGVKALATKFNPKHVLSAVGGKIRVTEYETLALLGSKSANVFTGEGYKALEKKLVVEIKKERRELVVMLLKDKKIQKAIKQRKIKKTTIMRYPYGKLAKMAQKYDLLPVEFAPNVNTLKLIRENLKLSIVQVAKAAGMKAPYLKKVEENPKPSQEEVDVVLAALTRITGKSNFSLPVLAAETK